MHSFDVDADGTITVGRLMHKRAGDVAMDDLVPMRKFTDLLTAVRFVNFLNGGYGSVSAHYANSMLEKSTPCQN